MTNICVFWSPIIPARMGDAGAWHYDIAGTDDPSPTGPFSSKDEAQAHAMDLYEEVTFFDGFPDTYSDDGIEELSQ
jgi:hypothetical protein